MLKPDNEKELLERYAKPLKPEDLKAFDKFKTRGELILLYEVLSRRFKDLDIAKHILSVIDPLKVDEIRHNYFAKNDSLTFSANLIG